MLTYIIIFVILFIYFVYHIYFSKLDKPYYTQQEVGVNLDSIKSYKIRKELDRLVDNNKGNNKNKELWIDWPEYHLYDTKRSESYLYDTERKEWKIIPIYAFGTWSSEYTRLCPETTKFLKSLPKDTLKTALFSKLGGNTRLTPHKGWAKLSNYILRCHYPIIVPEPKDRCYMVVDGDKKYHREGEWIIFDDSKLHYASNDTDSDRYILIIDIKRPDNIREGRSTVTNTKELDDLVSHFKKNEK